jgi:hypothetical protein
MNLLFIELLMNPLNRRMTDRKKFHRPAFPLKKLLPSKIKTSSVRILPSKNFRSKKKTPPAKVILNAFKYQARGVYLKFSLRLSPRFKAKRPPVDGDRSSRRRAFLMSLAQQRRCRRFFLAFGSAGPPAQLQWTLRDCRGFPIFDFRPNHSLFSTAPSKKGRLGRLLAFNDIVRRFFRKPGKSRPLINHFNRCVNLLRNGVSFKGPSPQRLSVIKESRRIINKRFWKNGSSRPMAFAFFPKVLRRLLFDHRSHARLRLRVGPRFRKFFKRSYRVWWRKIKAKIKLLALFDARGAKRRRLLRPSFFGPKRRFKEKFLFGQGLPKVVVFRKNFNAFFREAMQRWHFYELNRRRPVPLRRFKLRPFRFHRNRLALALLRKESVRLRPLRFLVGRVLSRPIKRRKQSPARLRYSMRRMNFLIRSHARGIPHDFPKPGDGFAWPSRIKESKIIPLLDIATTAINKANAAAVGVWQLKPSPLLAAQRDAFLYYFKGHLWDYRLPLALLPSSGAPPRGLFPFFDTAPLFLLYWQPLWSGLDQLGLPRNFLSHAQLSVNWRPLVAFLFRRSALFPWARLFLWTFLSRELFFWCRFFKKLKISFNRLLNAGRFVKKKLRQSLARHFQDAWTYPHLYEAQLNRLALLAPFLDPKLRALLVKNFRALLSYHPYRISRPFVPRDNGIWRMRRWLWRQRQYFRRTRRLLLTNPFFNRIKIWYRRLLHYRRLRTLAVQQKNRWLFFYHRFLKRRFSPPVRGMSPFSRAGQHLAYFRRRLNRKKFWRFRGALTLFFPEELALRSSGSPLAKADKRLRSLWSKRLSRRRLLFSAPPQKPTPAQTVANVGLRVRAKRGRPLSLTAGPLKIALSARYRWHFSTKTIFGHRLHRALSWLSAAHEQPISPMLGFSSFNALVFFWKALLPLRSVAAFTTPYALACFSWSFKNTVSKRRRYFRRWFTGFFYRKRRRGRRFVPAYYRRFNYIRRLPFRTFRLFWSRSANFVRSRIRPRPRPLRFSRRSLPPRKVMVTPSVFWPIIPNRRTEFRSLAAVL